MERQTTVVEVKWKKTWFSLPTVPTYSIYIYYLCRELDSESSKRHGLYDSAAQSVPVFSEW